MSAAVDTIEIQNVVASTGIDHELDLETLDEDLVGADFNPDNFPGLVYRTQDPKAAALIFRSEKSSAPAHQVLMMSMRRSISCSENSGILEYQSMILQRLLSRISSQVLTLVKL